MAAQRRKSRPGEGGGRGSARAARRKCSTTAPAATSPVHDILHALRKVRRTGPGRWIARCPAHADRSPSLSIREGADGRVLIHCFAGCGAMDVLDALGLDWRDLFPEPIDRDLTSRRARVNAPPITAADALDLLDAEALVVEVIAHRLAEGECHDRHAADLTLAASRIATVRRMFLERPT